MSGIFANFTSETCTGTGGTLELSGAITGLIAFSLSFSDGDLIAYSLKDSGGSIKIAGIGIYVSATDDILRNDTWNFNGTVVDENPSTNITLSGGTHTVSCDTSVDTVSGIGTFETNLVDANYMQFPDNIIRIQQASKSIANTLVLCSAFWASSIEFTKLTIFIQGLDAAGSMEIGYISTDADGNPDKLICSAVIDITTTGRKSVSCGTIKLPAGRYYMAIWTDSSIVEMHRSQYRSHTSIPGGYQFNTFNGGALSGIPSPNTGLPSDPSSVSYLITSSLDAFVVGVET